MIRKTALAKELGLDTVAIITGLLKAAKRPASAQMVEDADADLVRKAAPYWRKGHDYVEAIRLAKGEQQEQLPESADANVHENGNGAKPANSMLALQNQAQRQTAALDKQNKALGQKAILSKAVEHEKEAQTLYWLGRAAAANSPQVQNSEPVTAARDFYFQMQSGTVANVDVVADLEQTLEDLGFFGESLDASRLEGLLPAEETFSSQEPYSCANGYESGN
jgi:hypothetical protein